MAGLVPVIEVTYYCHTVCVGYPFTNLQQNVYGFHSINTTNTTHTVTYTCTKSCIFYHFNMNKHTTLHIQPPIPSPSSPFSPTTSPIKVTHPPPPPSKVTLFLNYLLVSQQHQMTVLLQYMYTTVHITFGEPPLSMRFN